MGPFATPFPAKLFNYQILDHLTQATHTASSKSGASAFDNDWRISCSEEKQLAHTDTLPTWI